MDGTEIDGDTGNLVIQEPKETTVGILRERFKRTGRGYHQVRLSFASLPTELLPEDR